VRLWKGGLPTVIRATLLSSAVLGCYSEVKEQLHSRLPSVFPDKNGIPLMFVGTTVASFVANGAPIPRSWARGRGGTGSHCPRREAASRPCRSRDRACGWLTVPDTRTGVSNPFDVVKSRVQNMPKPAPGEKPLYAGMGDCFVKSVRGEGPAVLMRGFVPAFLKLAPYTTISLILTGARPARPAPWPLPQRAASAQQLMGGPREQTSWQRPSVTRPCRRVSFEAGLTQSLSFSTRRARLVSSPAEVGCQCKALSPLPRAARGTNAPRVPRVRCSRRTTHASVLVWQSHSHSLPLTQIGNSRTRHSFKRRVLHFLQDPRPHSLAPSLLLFLALAVRVARRAFGALG